MQLSKFTDYGLRVLMHLVAVSPDKVSVHKIAESFGISEHHVAKVASQLVKGGFVVSGRGRAGGLRLAQDPKDISIGAVVRYLSGDIPVAECFNTAGCDCRVFTQCGLRGPLYEAQQAFYAVLDKYTLEGTVKERSLLRELLEPNYT